MPHGVLVEDEIKDLSLIKPPLGGELDPRCYKPTSFDLRLGGECIYIKVGPHEVSDCTDGIIIEPFSSVMVSTYERVELPVNVVGKFNLRIKLALEGLIVQMGTQVEPNYKGPLFAMLLNMSDKKIKLSYRNYDTRPFTIEFTYTSKPAVAASKTIKSIGDILPQYPAEGTINTIVEDLRTAQKDIKANETPRIKFFNTWVGIGLTLVVTVIIAITATAVPVYVAPELAEFRINRNVLDSLKGRDVTNKLSAIIDNKLSVYMQNENRKNDKKIIGAKKDTGVYIKKLTAIIESDRARINTLERNINQLKQSLRIDIAGAVSSGAKNQ